MSEIKSFKELEEKIKETDISNEDSEKFISTLQKIVKEDIVLSRDSRYLSDFLTNTFTAISKGSISVEQMISDAKNELVQIQSLPQYMEIKSEYIKNEKTTPIYEQKNPINNWIELDKKVENFFGNDWKKLSKDKQNEFINDFFGKEALEAQGKNIDTIEAPELKALLAPFVNNKGGIVEFDEKKLHIYFTILNGCLKNEILALPEVEQIKKIEEICKEVSPNISKEDIEKYTDSFIKDGKYLEKLDNRAKKEGKSCDQLIVDIMDKVREENKKTDDIKNNETIEDKDESNLKVRVVKRSFFGKIVHFFKNIREKGVVEAFKESFLEPKVMLPEGGSSDDYRKNIPEEEIGSGDDSKIYMGEEQLLAGYSDLLGDLEKNINDTPEEQTITDSEVTEVAKNMGVEMDVAAINGQVHTLAQQETHEEETPKQEPNRTDTPAQEIHEVETTKQEQTRTDTPAQEEKFTQIPTPKISVIFEKVDTEKAKELFNKNLGSSGFVLGRTHKSTPSATGKIDNKEFVSYEQIRKEGSGQVICTEDGYHRIEYYDSESKSGFYNEETVSENGTSMKFYSKIGERGSTVFLKQTQSNGTYLKEEASSAIIDGGAAEFEQYAQPEEEIKEYAEATGLPIIIDSRNGMKFREQTGVKSKDLTMTMREEDEKSSYPYIVSIEAGSSTESKKIKYAYTSPEAYKNGKKPYMIYMEGLDGRKGFSGMFRLQGDKYIDNRTFKKGEDGKYTYDTLDYEQVMSLAGKMYTNVSPIVDSVIKDGFKVPPSIQQIYDKAKSKSTENITKKIDQEAGR